MMFLFAVPVMEALSVILLPQMLAARDLARLFTGKLDAQRRLSFESAALLAYYTAAQGLLGFLLIYGFPRMLE